VPSTTTPNEPDVTPAKERDKDADDLSRADAKRRSGDCDGAVKLYESVRKHGTKSQRAKALVGLALCAERKGNRDLAEDLLSEARAQDANTDAYYDAER
jgi:hypothetical protein